uniref:CWH43-like N-terminal domain-containing protein n=1 Tax=Onchocerca volvulus TaxID=6282 RepID=A0A8R1TTB6_ONCVO
MESKWTEQQLDNKNNRKTTYSPSPVYVKNGKTVIELFRLSPVTVFLFGFIPPLIGAFAAIIAALIFHNEQISNYNWQCGRARLPSLSRIINLPLERLIWQFLVLIQTPARIIELITGFHRYGRLMNVNYQHKQFYQFARYVYFYAGIAELFFMIGLSLIGERENIQAHVILFYIFGFCGIIFFIANLICHRHSLYFLHPYGLLSYYLKLAFCTIYLLSVPILLISFLLYWKICVTVAYDVFAICEYVGVFLNIAYHGCAFYDIRYKVIFSVRFIEANNFQRTIRKELCDHRM